ncbi:MAG TPA: PKD domain-containing protein [Bacteroidia bacterium]|jgi:PKD repeat protein
MKTTTNIRTLAFKAVCLAGLLLSGYNMRAQCNADFTYSTSPANDGTVYFNNTSTNSVSTFYYWDFSNGSSSNAASPTNVFPNSGTYTVCLYLYDTVSTCSDTICHVVTVTNSSSPGCSAVFTPYDSLGYGYFHNQSTGAGLNSTWTFGDGTAATSTGDITHNYTTPGTYYVCLTVSNSLGCSSTYCDSIRINHLNSGWCLGAVNANFNASDSAGYGVFHNTPSGTAPVYTWDFGDGTTGTDVGNTSHYYTSPGTYTVCLTVYETGGTYDSCMYCSTVTIGGGSTGGCDASFVVIQDTTNSFNYFVYNNAFNTGSTMTYLWDFGDGTTSTLQYPTHTYANNMPYQLCLTVTETSPAFSCTDTFCDSVATGHGAVPITVTVVNQATGIAEALSSASLENYPNPFSESTTTKYSIASEASVDLYLTDLLGKRVITIESSRKPAGSYSAELYSNGLSEGMYLLQIRVNNKLSTRKIVLSK